MKLYRVCKEKEGDIILNTGEFSELGSNYRNGFKNNFNYEHGKKYLHFFKYFGDIHYLYLGKGYYICEYDIPDELVPKPSHGYYMDFVSFKNPDIVEEYVIESKDIKFEYLTEMHRILEFIDYEDYISGNMASMLEEVYKKEKELTHEKKLPKNE